MIGERLSDLRNDRGLTQKDLARILHMTHHNISAYERGRNEPPDNVKIAIARYFDVSVDYLLGLTDSPNAYDKPGNYILLSKDFPPAAKTLLESLVRMISLAADSNPKAVSEELNRIVQDFLNHYAQAAPSSSQDPQTASVVLPDEAPDAKPDGGF